MALRKGIKVDGRRLIMITVEEVYGDKDDLNEAEARHEQHLISEGYVLKNTAPCGGGSGRQSEEQRKQTSEAVKKAYRGDPTIHQRLSEATTLLWQDEEYAKACREGLAKAVAASQRSRPLWQAAVNEASRAALSKPCLRQSTGRHGYLVIDW